MGICKVSVPYNAMILSNLADCSIIAWYIEAVLDIWYIIQIITTWYSRAEFGKKVSHYSVLVSEIVNFIHGCQALTYDTTLRRLSPPPCTWWARPNVDHHLQLPAPCSRRGQKGKPSGPELGELVNEVGVTGRVSYFWKELIFTSLIQDPIQFYI